MSGVVDNYWAMTENKNHLELANQIVKDFGESKDTTEELVAFLKSTPADKLNKYNDIIPGSLLFILPLTPVIESKCSRK